MRLAQQVGRAVPVRRGSPLPERRGSQLQVLPADSQLQELLGSQLQALPALQLEELRAEMFVVAREIALAKSVQMRVRLGRQ
jgi:hypothetical protein